MEAEAGLIRIVMHKPANTSIKNLVVLLITLLPALAAAPVSRAALQKQDIALIERAMDSARDAEDAVERLQAYSRTPDEYSRPCHLLQLDGLKESINTMAPAIDRLASTRDQLEEVDRKAVTRIVILAVELAQSTNAMILQADATPDAPSLDAGYRKLVEQCHRESSELVKALAAGIVELR